MGDWPNDTQALGAEHPARLRGARCDGCRPTHIDLYQMHHVDRDTPWDEIWQAMETLRQPGQDPLRRQSSNFAGWHIAQAQEAAQRRALHRPGQRAVASTTC